MHYFNRKNTIWYTHVASYIQQSSIHMV